MRVAVFVRNILDYCQIIGDFTHADKYFWRFLLTACDTKLLPCCIQDFVCDSEYMQSHDDHAEAALYWSAVSLIVCEGMPVHKAAKRLGVNDSRLREILQRRQEMHTELPYPPTRPISTCAG